jgi:hypothetical protein
MPTMVMELQAFAITQPFFFLLFCCNNFFFSFFFSFFPFFFLHYYPTPPKNNKKGNNSTHHSYFEVVAIAMHPPLEDNHREARSTPHPCLTPYMIVNNKNEARTLKLLALLVVHDNSSL